MAQCKTILIANGDCELSPQQIIHIKKIPMIIAVDGGIHHCLRFGFTPNIYVGDLDSASEKELAHFPQLENYIYPKDKNKTDLQLAIEIAFERSSQPLVNKKDPLCSNPLKEPCEFLEIYGALGGRTDHSLFNLLLLTRYYEKMVFLSKEETVFLIRGHRKIAASPGLTFSLLPINGPVSGVTTKGLKWELNDAKLDRSHTSLSNEALVSEVSVSVQEGDLLCMLSRTHNL